MSAPHILQDGELEAVYNDTNFSIPFQMQRHNIMIMGFRTGTVRRPHNVDTPFLHPGYRPDSLSALQVDAIERGTLDGRRWIRPSLGSMKNHQPNLDKVEAMILSQMVFETEDTRFCAVEAFDRQVWPLQRQTFATHVCISSGCVPGHVNRAPISGFDDAQ